MKKNYLLAIAVAALMLASEVAWAADITFSGQFRPRFQSSDDFTDTTDSRNYFTQRTRLNAKAVVNANTEVFLQFVDDDLVAQHGKFVGTGVIAQRDADDEAVVACRAAEPGRGPGAEGPAPRHQDHG